MSSVIHHTIFKHIEAQNLLMVVTVSRRYAAVVGAPHSRRGQVSRMIRRGEAKREAKRWLRARA